MNRWHTMSVGLLAVLIPLAAGACTETTATSGAASTSIAGQGSVPANQGSIPGTRPANAPDPVQVHAAAPNAGKADDRTLKTPDGRDRTYHVYVPTTLPTDKPVPLLLAFHGGTGWGAQFENGSGFNGLAESNQFIVVYPDGIPIPALPVGRVWNGGYCCGPAAQDRENVDDVTFVSLMLDELEQAYDIDPARIYSAGHSNGAIFSYRLACELSDRIVAIGVQAGSLGIDECNPAKPISVFHIHGTADMGHPIEGGVGPSGISGVDFHPAVDALTTFAKANGCDTGADAPAVSSEPGNADITFETWSGCKDGTVVQLAKVEGASHAWMGHPAIAPRATGEAYAKYDASLAVWTFLANHPRR